MPIVSGPFVYRGSCGCAAVQFTVQLDFAHGVTRCACPRCRKLGARSLAAPADHFRLVAGEDALEGVAWACGLRMRCAACGVEPFAILEDPEELVAINLRCLDGVELEDVTR